MSDQAEIEEELSRPAPADVAALRALAGDILVLGVSGKMGPSLARLARRASDEAGVARRVIGVARFSARNTRELLEAHGIETIACDLLDRGAVGRLPECPNVVYMVGQKFGTSGNQPLTWATNVHAAALAAERFAASRIVVFSTGNVYPLSSVAGPGPNEDDPVGPVGEYAESSLGRERMFEFFSQRHGTKIALLRLNYAIEPRYGVLRDLADAIVRGDPIDLAMGHVNVIWQRDANAVALRAFEHCASPPFVLNVTGPMQATHDLAERLGARLEVKPRFEGTERETALLSDATLCRELFGPPGMTVGAMIERVVDWVKAGGGSLGKPTHFQQREGEF
ncbi:MAG: NAD-dependent epimerase/dehydratase family protein [Gemmatimonadales bacterium]